MGNPSSSFVTSLWAAAFALITATACNSGDFGGGVGSRSANLRDNKKGQDDLNDGGNGNDSGTDSGKNGSGGDSDSGNGGSDSDGDNTDTLGGSDGENKTGIGGSDSTEPKPADLATSDDEVKRKWLHDATVTRSEHDDPFDLQIETLIKGIVVETNTLHFKSTGDAEEGPTAHLACRNSKDTCLRLTFTGHGSGGITQVLGASSCTKVLAASGNTAYVHADTNGAGIIGSCLPSGSISDDDGVHITCPQSKNLKVELCNGD